MLMKLVKSDCSSDWYCIERVEHDHKEWIESRTSSDGSKYLTLMCSARICDADVEGTLYEMEGLALAIKARRNQHYKRCCVEFVDNGFKLNSPRNSKEYAVVSIHEADYLASQIEDEIERVK